jgi:hypothetical protein
MRAFMAALVQGGKQRSRIQLVEAFEVRVHNKLDGATREHNELCVEPKTNPFTRSADSYFFFVA